MRVVNLLIARQRSGGGVPVVDCHIVEYGLLQNRVDWLSDEEKVQDQIYEVSYDIQELSDALYYEDELYTTEGGRAYLKGFAYALTQEQDGYGYLYGDYFYGRDFYFLDLVHWDRKPPVELTSEFSLVSFISVWKLAEGFELSMSSEMPYKEMGTRKVETLKEGLGIRGDICFFNVERVGKEELEERVRVLKEELKARFGSYPVLVYGGGNEAELREALTGTALYGELFNEGRD